MLQLIVLDMAGTTVYDDRDVSKSLQYALAESGVAISLADADALMGLPKPVAIRQLLEKYLDDKSLITEERIGNIHQTFVNHIIHHYETHPDIREKEGVSEIFALLKKNGVKIAIDTGFDRPIAAVIFRRLGWLENHLIDVSITSDEVPNGRPFPDMVFKAMQLTGVTDPKLVAKVGDTASDMQQGTAAGCGWVIGVTTGAYTEAELKRTPHTHLISHISELKGIFSL